MKDICMTALSAFLGAVAAIVVITIIFSDLGFGVGKQSKQTPKVRCDIHCQEMEMKREQEELRITQELKAWETFKKEQGIK